ncbi:cyclophilin-like fold protein [Streptomyces krungchingensis]|uniref:cyclophilin-like fold protein n=1 Tax=Streptomyces krungchingensis TaxID=1565034 RepID=UPI003CEC609A
MEKIEVMLDEHDFTVELNDNKTVDSLLRHLPMDITVGEDGGQRYYGPTPTPLPVDAAPATSSPRRGDLCYSKFWNAVVISTATARWRRSSWCTSAMSGKT